MGRAIDRAEKARNLRSDAKAAMDRDRLLTVAQAGEELGAGERYARRLIAERRIRFVKLGPGLRAPVRIPESAIRELIEAGTVPAAS